MTSKDNKDSPLDKEELTKIFESFIDESEDIFNVLELKKQEVSTSYTVLGNLKARLSEMSFNQKIQLDVGGRIFATSKYTLTNGKSEFFTKLFSTEQQAEFLTPEGTYFIDRNPASFSYILDYLRGNDIESFELSAKELKQLQTDIQFYGCRELMSIISESTAFVWKSGANASITDGGKVATATGHACYVYVDEAIHTSNKRTINVSVDTKGNQWAHVALGKRRNFTSLGNGFNSQQGDVPFMYHVNHGQVNGAGGFPSGPKAAVQLNIENGKVKFLVDGKQQAGEWTLPETVYLLCDIYHQGSTVSLK
jgi:hypothetical protein